MGRGGGRSGGGRSGGRSGGFSRGGSRGFSSRRSAGQGRSRGGGARSSARRSSSGFYSNRRRPGGSSPRPLFGGILFPASEGEAAFPTRRRCLFLPLTALQEADPLIRRLTGIAGQTARECAGRTGEGTAVFPDGTWFLWPLWLSSPPCCSGMRLRPDQTQPGIQCGRSWQKAPA